MRSRRPKKLPSFPPIAKSRWWNCPSSPGLLAKLLSGGLVTASAPELPAAMRSMAPALMMVKAALSRGSGTIGAVYCPVVPIW